MEGGLKDENAPLRAIFILEDDLAFLLLIHECVEAIDALLHEVGHGPYAVGGADLLEALFSRSIEIETEPCAGRLVDLIWFRRFLFH